MSPNPDGGGGGRRPPTILLDRDRTIQTGQCPNPVGVFALKSDQTIQQPIPCGKWTCSVCGPNKVKRLRARAYHGQLNARTLLTLTLHTDDQVNIMDAWNRFSASLKRAGWPFRYLLVKEWTRAGKQHLHLLVEGWLPYTQLSRLWRLATGGMSHRTHARRVSGQKGALGYITKYMSKGLGHKLFRKGERHYSASRGVLAPVCPPTGLWLAYIVPPGVMARPAMRSFLETLCPTTPVSRKISREMADWFPKDIWSEPDSV